jgi:hypothetical protein
VTSRWNTWQTPLSQEFKFNTTIKGTKQHVPTAVMSWKGHNANSR